MVELPDWLYIEMEVMIPIVHDMEFDFNSARSTPYPSAPSTPRRFGVDYYCSAPSSPSRLTEFYQEFDDFSIDSGTISNVKSPKGYTKLEEDFAFDIGDDMNFSTSVVSAEELFDGGMIKPMKPNQSRDYSSAQRRVDSTSPGLLSSPRSSKKVNMVSGFSPRHTKQSGSPVSAGPERERGRERTASGGLSSSSRRGSRSLSPLRVSQYPWEDHEDEEREQNQLLKNNNNKENNKPSSSSSSNTCSALTTSSSKGTQRKWRLKDFFLFRSASEGRASDKDLLKKYTAFFRRIDNPVSSSSSSSSSSGASNSRRRRRSGQGGVSPHELHYTANRAAKEELKKKTFLPYKQGILGRLAINPAVALANGFPFHK